MVRRSGCQKPLGNSDWKARCGTAVARKKVLTPFPPCLSIAIGLTTRSVKDLARKALQFPPNLGEARLPGAVPNDVWYHLGCAQEVAGDMTGSRDSLRRACAGEKSPAISLYYNDQPADLIFFQGLALARLGRDEEARRRFTSLMDYGERNRDHPVEIDYFAVSLPDMLIFDDDLSRRARVFCTYLQALGTLGCGDARKARALLEKVRAEEPSHAGARETLRAMDDGWRF